MQQRYVLTSCGISILTNRSSSDMRNLLLSHSNDTATTLSADDRERIDEWIQEVRQGIRAQPMPDAIARSAELTGLAGIYGGQLPTRTSDSLMFLHTDTYIGESACQIIVERLEAHGLKAQFARIDSLTTRNRETFLRGISNLIYWLEGQDIAGWQSRQYAVVFNLVGGFKVLQGYLTVLGMLYGAEQVYQFETSEELLRIPALPGLAGHLEELTRVGMEDYLPWYRQVALRFPPSERPPEQPPESLVRQDKEGWALSVWGDVVWQRVWRRAAERCLWPSPSPGVRYTDAFERDVAKYAHRLREINTTIDDLARNVADRAGGRSTSNPKSSTVKPLKGKHGPSTHEVYAWSDGDAGRMLLHFEGITAVIDALRGHL